MIMGLYHGVPISCKSKRFTSSKPRNEEVEKELSRTRQNKDFYSPERQHGHCIIKAHFR